LPAAVRTKFILVAALLVLPFVAAYAQQRVEYSADAERLFSDALALYTKGEYAQAASAFDQVLQRPLNQRTSSAMVMKGKAQLYAGDADAAESTLQLFLARFPFSNYRADAEYTLGLAYARKHLPDKSLQRFLNCWREMESGSANAALRAELFAALDSTIDGYLSLAALQRVLAEVGSGRPKEFLLLKLAQKQALSGDHDAAAATASLVQREFPSSSFPERLSALHALLNAPREFKLGVLLPLFQKNERAGREKDVGAALQEGIVFALEEYEGDPRAPRVLLEIRDTERDNVRAIAGLKELALDAAVIGIIGPAFSDEAFAVNTLANRERIPLITPTATANGIATPGSYVFQANPDLATRAKAIAQYAVKDLHLHRLAVLRSSEPSSMLLAEAFANEALRLGASVVATETYDKGATNLSQQMINLRRKGNAAAQEPFLSFDEKMTKKELGKLNKLGLSARLLDTLKSRRSVVSATGLLGDSARSKLQENAVPFLSGDPRIDSIQRTTDAIQGVYCPVGTPGEIGVIASQIAYFAIETQLLGSGEWNNIGELNANKRYCKGVVFESDSYLDVRDADVSDFTNRFVKRFRKQPNKNHLYGYDVARLVLSLMRKGATTREELRAALAEVRSFRALHARISLAPRQVNTWLNILQYSNDIQRMAEIDVE
jgi:ABC-type branched-subunit amino acid transport system substrate-binding protein